MSKLSEPRMRENLYDDEIAPALRALSERCTKKGLSLVAVVEWEPGETGRTLGLVPGSSFEMRLIDTAARSHGNVDTLFLAVMKYAREHGHSSMILAQLGVPLTPAGRSALEGTDAS